GDDDPAIAQACQLVGHVRACQVQISGQFRRVSGMVEQGQDDPGSSGVGQCTTQAVHHVETRSNSQHALNYTARAEHSVTGVSPDRTPVRGSFTARRLARSLPDARDIAGELTIKGVALSLGGSVYDPNDAVGRLLFNVLGMVAEFEANLIRRACQMVCVSRTERNGTIMTMTNEKQQHDDGPSGQDLVEQLKASGQLDALFEQIDAGQVELTGDGGFVPALVK